MEQGKLDEAETQFDEVLNRSPDHTGSVVALSLGGRAQIAVARHQIAAALASELSAPEWQAEMFNATHKAAQPASAAVAVL